MRVSNRLASTLALVTLLFFPNVFCPPVNAQIVEDTNITLFDMGSFGGFNFHSFEISQDFGSTDFTCMFFEVEILGNGMAAFSFPEVCLDESSAWYLGDFCQDFTEQSICNGAFQFWGGFGICTAQAKPLVVPINQPFFVGINTGLGFDGSNDGPNRDAFGWAELVVDNAGVVTMLDNAIAYDLGGIVIGKNQAVETVAPPSSFNVFRGVQLSGSDSDFASSDDVVASYNPGFTLNSEEAPVWLEFFAAAPSATNFRVESSAGTPGLEYTVEAFNFVTNSYDVIGTQTETFNTDQVVEFAVVADDHIDTNGDVQSRVDWRSVGFTINFPWVVNVDQTGWTQ